MNKALIMTYGLSELQMSALIKECCIYFKVKSK